VRPAGVAKRRRQGLVAYRAASLLFGPFEVRARCRARTLQAASELCAGRVGQIVDGILAWVVGVLDDGDLACGEGGKLCLNLAHLL